jgi:DNA-binding winged helix-turn-helix (wHTH) protein/tetratricopeptide (TPR) repeat protein
MAFTSRELQAGFLIGECRIEPLENRIERGATRVHVEPRVMDVLVCLAERAGEVVSRDTLNQRVWANIVVTDQAVTNCISELRHHLGDDRSTNRIIETIPKRGYRLVAPVRLVSSPQEPLEPPAMSMASRERYLAAGVVLFGLVVAGLAWWLGRASPVPAATSVAVLRFENAAGKQDLDYLALALPDEVATLLTNSSGLAVRPLGYVSGDDPIAAARTRHVDHVVSGRYYLEDDAHLSLAIEAQHVQGERVVWRTRISVPMGDLLVMRGRLAEGVRDGLLPALGARALPISGSPPTDDEAYQLYLRSLAFPQQQKQGERAIEMLERAVQLEPTFAPAWHALGLRYYDYGTWWGGGKRARERSLAAHRRALELDPGMIAAARRIVTHQAESADLEGAYREARGLLERFGPSAETHFAIAYVYKYGGDLEASQRQCELARERDPQDPGLRSCAYSYLYAGELPRVMDYLLLDEGSYFVNWGTVLYHLRTNDRDAALHATRQAADDPTRRLMEPCLEDRRGVVLDDAVAGFLEIWQETGDPEASYAVAPMLLYCGRRQEALRLLERAVDMSFCAFPALDLDPAWASLRGDADFQRIRGKASACHERFQAAVERVEAESSNH